MSFLDYLSTNWDHVLELAIGHALVVAISLAIAVVIGVSLGVLVYRRERLANAALAVTSTFLTIPPTQPCGDRMWSTGASCNRHYRLRDSYSRGTTRCPQRSVLLAAA